MPENSGTVPIKLKARFSFFAVLGLLVCTDKQGVSLLCAAACILHELGHIAVMLIERAPPKSVMLYGGGIQISGGSKSFCAACAGVAMNTALFLLFGVIPWYSGEIRLFGAVNLLIAVFNLLPIGELDGRLLLEKALIRVFSPTVAARVSETVEKVTAAVLIPAVILLVQAGYVNFSAVIFLIYVLAVEFLEKI